MWSPEDLYTEFPGQEHIYSPPRTRASSLKTIDHDYSPDSPDFPGRTSYIPLLHKDLSHGQTFHSRSKIARDAQNQYPSPGDQSQTWRASTRRHPFASQFEGPDWLQLFIHSGLCILAYPLLLLMVTIASPRPLFWTRTIVALGCGLIGFILGLIPLAFGQKFFEATGGFLTFVLHSTNSLTQLYIYSVGHRYPSVVHSRESWHQT